MKMKGECCVVWGGIKKEMSSLLALVVDMAFAWVVDMALALALACRIVSLVDVGLACSQVDTVHCFLNLLNLWNPFC